MGFEPEDTIYNLTFIDEDMQGLKVSATSPSLGEFMEITKLAELANKDIKPEDMAKVMPMFEMFIDHINEWNLERKGEPVPVTVDGLFTQKMPFIMKVVDAWMRAVVVVPTPLAPPSLDGDMSLAASIPMEPLSQSRVS